MAEPQATPVTQTKVIDEQFSLFVDELIQQSGVKGLSLAISRPDGEIEYGSWGAKTEEGAKVTPKTLFGIGSCSKAFTATALGILIDDYSEGRNVVPLPNGVSSFTWRTKVKNLLPSEWNLMDHWATTEANLQDIVSHVIGLPDHDLMYGSTEKLEDVMNRFRHLRPSFEFREKWQYNNLVCLHLLVASYIVSKYSDMPFTTFVYKRILGPLEMDATTYYSNDDLTDFSQTFIPEGRRIPYWLPASTVSITAGAGALISNIIDMSKWLGFLLNKGVIPKDGGARIIKKSTFDTLITASAVASGGENLTGYCKGWGKINLLGHELITHGGGLPGVSSNVAFLPNDNLGVAVLTNVGDRNFVCQAVTNQVFQKVLQLPVQQLSMPRRPGTSSSSSLTTPSKLFEVNPDREDSGIPGPTSSSSSTLPTFPLSAYAGTYSNPGYGTIHICSPDSTSERCKKVLADFRLFDGDETLQGSLEKRSSGDLSEKPQNRPTLYSAWPRLWCSHVRLYHRDKDTFMFQLCTLYPEGYGNDKTPFGFVNETDMNPRAEFVIETTGGGKGSKVVGFGLFGLLRVGKNPREEGPGSVQERADTWFDRVGPQGGFNCRIL